MNLNQFTDYTYLKKDLDGFDNFLQNVKLFDVAAFCVYPEKINALKQLTTLPVATVINFPEGNHLIEQIKIDIKLAINADEFDVVFPYKYFLNNASSEAILYFEKILDLLPKGKVIKIILESGQFADLKSLELLCKKLINYPIHFLKTSTGKTSIGATLGAAEVILKTIKSTNIGFKASGGIRSYQQAIAYYKLAETSLGSLTTDKFRLGLSTLLKQPKEISA